VIFVASLLIMWPITPIRDAIFGTKRRKQPALSLPSPIPQVEDSFLLNDEKPSTRAELIELLAYYEEKRAHKGSQ